MTTYTITFPHASGIPIAVTRHAANPLRIRYDYIRRTVPHTYHASLASVLRLIRLATERPRLVPHSSGCALEVVVNKP